MKISNKKVGNKRVLQLSGTVTLPGIDQFRNSLLKAFESPEKKIELDLDNVQEVDLAFIQVIASALKTVKGNIRDLSVKSPVPDAVTQVINLAGLSNHGNCHGDTCTWCVLTGMLLENKAVGE